jgi:hypothetical protein
MKQRHGFVSNSSSSAFILVFPKVPEIVKEMEELLFGDELYVEHPYKDLHPACEKFSTKEIAAIVLHDITHKPPALPLSRHDDAGHIETIHDLENIVRDGWLNKYEGIVAPKMEWNYDPNETDADRDKRYKEHDKAMDEFADKVAKKILKKWPLKHLYRVEYADEDGDLGSTMEHGEIFNKIPHIRISKH